MKNYETKEVLFLRCDEIEITKVLTRDNCYTGIDRITRLKIGTPRTIYTFHGGVHETLESALRAYLYHNRRKA